MISGRASDTAQVVCLIRALDAVWRGDTSPIKDVYAKSFLTPAYGAAYRVSANPAGRAALFPMRWLYNWIVLRHAFIDELVRELGPTMPIVLLGAGYDSRAWRLHENIHRGLYEIDFASTHQLKPQLAAEACLEPSGAIFIEADFASESLTTVFDRTGLRGMPALVVWEGVSMYLEEEVIRNTLRETGKFFGPGSVLVADFWMSGYDRFRRRIPAAPISDLIRAFVAEPFLFGTTPQEITMLARTAGVPETEIHTNRAIARRFAFQSSLIRAPYFVATFKY